MEREAGKTAKNWLLVFFVGPGFHVSQRVETRPRVRLANVHKSPPTGAPNFRQQKPVLALPSSFF